MSVSVSVSVSVSLSVSVGFYAPEGQNIGRETFRLGAIAFMERRNIGGKTFGLGSIVFTEGPRAYNSLPSDQRL